MYSSFLRLHITFLKFFEKILTKIKLLVTLSDNMGMKLNGEYFRLKDLVKELKIEKNAIKVRLFRLDIKPVTAEAIYDASVLDKLRNVPGKGRPKKQPEPETKGRKKPK